MKNTNITVSTEIKLPINWAWKSWITPEDIVKWNAASEDWQTTSAENDFRPCGRFSYRMEARDGTMGFDYWGTYERIIVNKEIRFKLGDGRKVKIIFTDKGDKTEVAETFEAESSNSVEMQKEGWQSILENFRKYSESKYKLKV